jgi:hypothetical protein
MRVQPARAIAAVACVLVLFLAGCDYCRCGRYKITMWPPPQQSATLTVTGSDQQQIVSLLQSALRERKFTELRPDYRTREGADVSWEVTTPGEVRVAVGAFGAKREVRESERVG